MNQTLTSYREIRCNFIYQETLPWSTKFRTYPLTFFSNCNPWAVSKTFQVGFFYLICISITMIWFDLSLITVVTHDISLWIPLHAFLNLNEHIGMGRISKACLIYCDSSWNKSVPWVMLEFGIVWSSLRMNFWWGYFHCVSTHLIIPCLL